MTGSAIANSSPVIGAAHLQADSLSVFEQPGQIQSSDQFNPPPGSAERAVLAGATNIECLHTTLGLRTVATHGPQLLCVAARQDTLAIGTTGAS